MLPVLFCAATVSGCGGGSLSAPLPQPIVPPPAAPVPPAAPTPAPAGLVVSSESLALAVLGQPRHFVITNVGGQDALNLLASATTALPAGTSLTTDCATLAPGASCALTVTPGAMPSAAPGDLAPVPAEVSLDGTNTNRLALSVWVLNVGSVYQGGLLFDIDDLTPAAGSIGGKVFALQEVGGRSLRGSPDYVSIAPAANSTSDGAANTAAIVAQFGAPPFADPGYPAWACHSSEESGFTDWYLPAICELGYDDNNAGTGCGTRLAPALPNVRSNLVDQGHMNASTLYVWSSTQFAPSWTWQQLLGLWPAPHQKRDAMFVNEFARCARALTP
jgi:hypothetical protein